jgi:hypothetical protein
MDTQKIIRNAYNNYNHTVGFAICRFMGLKVGVKNPLANSVPATIVNFIIDASVEGVLYDLETLIIELNKFQDPYWQSSEWRRTLERLHTNGVLCSKSHKLNKSPTCNGTAVVINEEKLDYAKGRMDNWIQRYADNRDVIPNGEKEYQSHYKEYKQWELQFISVKASFRQLVSRRKVA